MIADVLTFAAEVSSEGLVAVGVLFIMFGWLVPARMVRTIVASKDKVIAEQSAHLDTQGRTINALLKGNTAAESVVSAAAQSIRESDV